MTAGPARPPAGLGASGRAFWRRVVDDCELAPPLLTLLEVCCQALDRLAEARAAIKRDGPYQVTKGGALRPHPALRVEADSRIAFYRGQRELGINVADADESRPPRLGGARL